jgi:hypothetical protein
MKKLKFPSLGGKNGRVKGLWKNGASLTPDEDALGLSGKREEPRSGL